MKKCPYCAEEIQDEAILCRFCGRDIPIAAPTQISHYKRTQPPPTPKSHRSPFKIIFLILIILSGLWRIADAYDKERFSRGIFDVTCSDCPEGVPLYDDIRVGQKLIGYIPLGEECQSEGLYDGRTSKATLEAKYQDVFLPSAFYYVKCPSGEGWIKQENRGR